MLNLAAIGLAGAIRTIQLVDARDGSARPATDVIDAGFTAALERLSTKLEGKTARQKNPHAPGSLAFVSWIAARLGGWIATIIPPAPRPCAPAGPASPQSSKAIPLLHNSKIRESHSSHGERVGVRG
jgi:hypothetical protein